MVNRFTGRTTTPKPTRYFSKKQETRGNAIIGLNNTPNSGATLFIKGDGRDQHLLMEWKTLVKPQKSRTIQKEWFTKNQEEAFATGRQYSAVGFDFGDGEDYVAVPVKDFAEFYGAWREKYGEED